MNLQQEQAAAFLRALDPMAVMRIPGCIPLVVNPAHRGIFGSDLPVARSHSDYPRELRAPLKGRTRCYCEAIQAIVALKPEDCIFEALADGLRKGREPKGFELQRISQNGHRIYRLYRVHGRWLAADLFEFRLVSLPQLELRIGGNNSHRPTALHGALLMGGRTLMEADFPVPGSGAGPYENADAFLHRAEQRCGRDSEETILNQLRNGAGEIDKTEYRLFGSLVDTLTLEAAGNGGLRRHLGALRARIWDSLVAGQLREEMERRLDDRAAWLRLCARLPPRDQLPLLRAVMTADQLRDQDRYLGMIELPPAYELDLKAVREEAHEPRPWDGV